MLTGRSYTTSLGRPCLRESEASAGEFLWYSMGWASSGAISTASLIFQIRAKTATALQADNAHGVICPTHPGNAGQRPNSVGRITARGYPPLIRGIGGYRLWRYSPYKPRKPRTAPPTLPQALSEARELDKTQ